MTSKSQLYELEANPFLSELGLDPALAIESIDKEIAIRKARASYFGFVQHTTQNYKESKFHRFLCDTIEKFMTTPTTHAFDILCLSVPPQLGKSTTVTEALPAWALMRDPTTKIILAGYNEDFCTRFGRRNKEKIETFAHELYPDCVLVDSPCSNVEFETTKKGRCVSRGIYSGITGNPANLIVIDDPIRNQQDASSPTMMNSLWSEYLASIRTRIAPGGKIVVIQTRWVEDDLIGRILANEDNVTYINSPCECDDPEHDPLGRKLGDSICPELGRGNDWLKDFKKVYISESGSRVWNALYQGRPTALEGNLLKKEWWQKYKVLPDNIPYKIISVDAAFKDAETNDFVAIQEWGKINKKFYMIKYIKKHLNFVDTLQAIRTMRAQDPEILFVLIEDKANGSALINVLSSEMDGVIPVKPEGGKVARVNAVSPAVERGDVFLPEYETFTDEFIKSCAEFPNGAHDDDVDAFSQALNRMMYVDADVVAPQHIKYTVYTDDMLEDYQNADDQLKTELCKLWGYPAQIFDEDYYE